MLSPSPGRDGNEAARLEAELREPGAILGLDGVEPLLRVAHQVHLVDQHGDLADAQQVEQVAVAPRVLLHAFLGVDHQQRRLGLRGPGHHVLDELLVPRRVDDHVLPLLRMEPDLRGVDGDVLVALGLERVHQVRPLEGDAAALGDLLELLQLAFGQRARVVEQPAHQRGLAVVHVADDDDLELLGGSLDGIADWVGNAHGPITCNRRGGASRRRLRFPGPAPGRRAPRSGCGAAPRRSRAPCGPAT